MVRADATVIDVVALAIWENGGTGGRIRQLAVVEDVTEKRRLTALSHFAEPASLMAQGPSAATGATGVPRGLTRSSGSGRSRTARVSTRRHTSAAA